MWATPFVPHSAPHLYVSKRMKLTTLILFALSPLACFGKSAGEATFKDEKNDILIKEFEEDFFDIEKTRVTYNGKEKIWIEFHTSGEIPKKIRSLSRFIVWFDLDDEKETGVVRHGIGMDIAAFVGKTSEIKEWNGRVADYSQYAIDYPIEVTKFKVEDKKVVFELTSERFTKGVKFQLIFQTKAEDALLDELGPVEVRLEGYQDGVRQ